MLQKLPIALAQVKSDKNIWFSKTITQSYR